MTQPNALKAFDFTKIADRVGGDFEYARWLIELYSTHSARLLDDLMKAVQGDDPNAVQDAAHRMKGSVSFIEAETVRLLCQDIETAARNGDLAQAKNHVALLLPALNQLDSAISDFE